MILKIDFENKTIEVGDSTPLGEIVEKMKELELEWKEFKIKPTKVNIINIVKKDTYIPYIEPQPIQPYQPTYPWGWPVITCVAPINSYES